VRKKQRVSRAFYIIKSGKKGDYEFRGKFWIEGKDGTFLGVGRATLLQKIKEYGSISKAAKAMNMSYKRAWELVESINKQAKEPLVITHIGGKGGGGAKLTPEGERILKQFWEVYHKFEEFLKEEIKHFKF